MLAGNKYGEMRDSASLTSSLNKLLSKLLLHNIIALEQVDIKCLLVPSSFDGLKLGTGETLRVKHFNVFNPENGFNPNHDLHPNIKHVV